MPWEHGKVEHDKFSIMLVFIDLIIVHQFTQSRCVCMYDVHMYSLSWVNRQEIRWINKTDPSILWWPPSHKHSQSGWSKSCPSWFLHSGYSNYPVASILHFVLGKIGLKFLPGTHFKENHNYIPVSAFWSKWNSNSQSHNGDLELINHSKLFWHPSGKSSVMLLESHFYLTLIKGY